MNLYEKYQLLKTLQEARGCEDLANTPEGYGSHVAYELQLCLSDLIVETAKREIARATKLDWVEEFDHDWFHIVKRRRNDGTGELFIVWPLPWQKTRWGFKLDFTDLDSVFNWINIPVKDAPDFTTLNARSPVHIETNCIDGEVSYNAVMKLGDYLEHLKDRRKF